MAKSSDCHDTDAERALSQVFIRNYINFERDHVIDLFEEGIPETDNESENRQSTNQDTVDPKQKHDLFVFVGENSSGKSSMFEIISMASNLQTSDRCCINPFNTKETAFAFCKYSDCSGKTTIYTGLMYFPEYGHYQGVIETKTAIGTSTLLFRKASKQSEWYKQEFPNMFMNNNHKGIIDALNELMTITDTELRKKKMDRKATNNSERLSAKGHLSNNVFLLSGQEKFNILKEFHEKAVPTLQDKSRIDLHALISQLYPRITRPLRLDKISKTDELIKLYSRIKQFGFPMLIPVIDNGQVKYKDEKTGKIFEQSQISDGLLDILTIVIILKSPCNTLLLEEPTKAMHPSLVQKFTWHLIELARETGKMIIITTHSPHVLTAVRLENVYRFHRSITGTTHFKRVPTSEMRHVDKNFFIRPQFREILFARKVIVCEGPSDQRFLEILFWNLSHASKIDRMLQTIFELNEKEISDFKSNISDTHVIPADGKGQINRDILPKLKLLGIPYDVVCDGDYVQPFEKDDLSKKWGQLLKSKSTWYEIDIPAIDIKKPVEKPVEKPFFYWFFYWFLYKPVYWSLYKPVEKRQIEKASKILGQESKKIWEERQKCKTIGELFDFYEELSIFSWQTDSCVLEDAIKITDKSFTDKAKMKKCSNTSLLELVDRMIKERNKELIRFLKFLIKSSNVQITKKESKLINSKPRPTPLQEGQTRAQASKMSRRKSKKRK